jgi:hypothetical protein
MINLIRRFWLNFDGALQGCAFVRSEWSRRRRTLVRYPLIHQERLRLAPWTLPTIHGQLWFRERLAKLNTAGNNNKAKTRRKRAFGAPHTLHAFGAVVVLLDRIRT